MVFKCENCDLHVILLPHRCRVAWNFFRFYGSRTRKDLDRKHLGIRCISDSCEATFLLSRAFAYLGATQKSQHMRSTRDGTRTHNLFLRREAPYPLGHTSLAISASENCTRHCIKSHLTFIPVFSCIQFQFSDPEAEVEPKSCHYKLRRSE